MARVGVGSWSFMGVQAVVAGFAKLVPLPHPVDGSSVPGVARGLLQFIINTQRL